MKLYGYSTVEQSEDTSTHRLLAEITLCAPPAELRRIAEFLVFCAAEMERMGATYDHVHLSDKFKEFRQSPHFVVASP